MKDIVLKITGKTVDRTETVEDMQLVTEGRLYTRGTTTFISYPESALSGLEGCTTSLTITPSSVKLKRSGEQLAVSTVMEFRKGKRFYGFYDTPYGALSMELLTNDISGPRSLPDGGQALTIDYDISLKGLTDSRKLLDIEFRDKN